MEISSKEIKERIKELTKKSEINTKDELKLFLVDRAYKKGYEEGIAKAKVRYVKTDFPDEVDLTVYDYEMFDLQKELKELQTENEQLRSLLGANVRTIKAEIKKEMEEENA